MQINGLFVMGLTLIITSVVALLMFRSSWGLQVRAVVSNRTMSGAVGIDTPEDHVGTRVRVTFPCAAGPQNDG